MDDKKEAIATRITIVLFVLILAAAAGVFAYTLKLHGCYKNSIQVTAKIDDIAIDNHSTHASSSSIASIAANGSMFSTSYSYGRTSDLSVLLILISFLSPLFISSTRDERCVVYSLPLYVYL